MSDVPSQLLPQNLAAICIKALRHARAENYQMLLDVLRALHDGGEACLLPSGFTAVAFDRLAYDTPEEEAQLKHDLMAIANSRHPLDRERELRNAAIADHMVLSYDAARAAFGTADWKNVVIGGHWRLSQAPDWAGYAVVPK